MDKKLHIKNILSSIYDAPIAQDCYNNICELIDEYASKINDRKKNNGYGPNVSGDLNERDVLLITYGDQILGDEKHKPLQNLKYFSDKYFNNIVSGIHILPFFPYSSDDGFSVKDYCLVDEQLGNWDDISNLTENFRLMFDYVANHMSSQSEWFKEFLKGNPEYEDYFVTIEGEPDLSNVIRPRANPLLTKFEKEGKEIKVWTTFSADQVDVKYANPKVLVAMTKILLEYYLQGASMIRLDAILYMWKTLGTVCAHLPETHAIIQMWRLVTEIVLPEAVILAEVSAPHKDNITYLGNGKNECHMIYQFPLAPLVLYSFLKQDTKYLTNWAKGVDVPSAESTFFNLLACHDGIGLMPARGILPEEEIIWLADEMKKKGGDVSFKANSDGTESPYELNIVYLDAISDENATDDQNIKRFLCAYGIALGMKGVPGLYVHALLGSHNYKEGVLKTGMKRTINRQKFILEEIDNEMSDLSSQRRQVFDGFKQMTSVRQKSKAFDPYGAMRIIDLGNSVFGIVRASTSGEEFAVALYNITSKDVDVTLNSKDLEGLTIPGKEVIISAKVGTKFTNAFDSDCFNLSNDGVKINLAPYEFKWFIG